jgi:hypothetical protein
MTPTATAEIMPMMMTPGADLEETTVKRRDDDKFSRRNRGMMVPRPLRVLDSLLLLADDCAVMPTHLLFLSIHDRGLVRLPKALRQQG